MYVASPVTYSQSFNRDQDNTDNSKFRSKCTEWIQSGCPLGSNMLINTCPNNMENITTKHNSRFQDRHRQQKRVIQRSKILGKEIK